MTSDVMHIPESQRDFLDTVQTVLRRYDAQLRDINHKACGHLPEEDRR